MSDDLPERLRTWGQLDKVEAWPVLAVDLQAAADEIDMLHNALDAAVSSLNMPRVDTIPAIIYTAERFLPPILPAPTEEVKG